MLIWRVAVCTLAIGMVMPASEMAFGQSAATGSGQATSISSGPAYPSKPIRIMTAESGGSTDIQSRLIAQGISGPLGQQVIVDNRTGYVSIGTAAKAPPDGYTILYFGSVIWTQPLLLQNAAWDPVRDFAPLTLATSSPNVVVVHPSLPVKSVKELIALAKARPGELNYGSTSTGSTNHLGAEMFKFMAKVDMVRISYKGTAGALNDILAGQVQVMFPSAGGAAPFVKSARLKALAVTSAQPSALAPGLPTAAASGLPGYELVALYALFVPSKTPAAVVNRLNQEILRVLNLTDTKEKLLGIGVEVVASSPAQLYTTMKAEIDRLEKMIKAAGIRPE